MTRVFLSYAEEDASLARRIHIALADSGTVSPWGFKENGRIAENFKDEFEDQIKSSEYFCLLDTPDARKSRWIKDECGLARRSVTKVVVCRAVDFSLTPEALEQELFEGHNLQAAVSFLDYNNGIRQLFKFFQIIYSPWSAVPRDQDFDKEIWKAGLAPNVAQELVNLYREFREHFADPDFAEALLRVVIRKCDLAEANDVVSPRLALAVMHANAGRHQLALKTFADLSGSHPTDPRTWAGMAGAHFHLNQYADCLTALHRSKEFSLAYYRNESAERMPEIVHNIAAVHVLLGRLEDASAALDSLAPASQAHPFVNAIRGRIALSRGEYRQALPHLVDACAAIDVSPDTVIDLADCYVGLRRYGDELALLEQRLREMSDCPEVCHRAAQAFLRKPDRSATAAAVSAMRQAAAVSSEVPRYRAQYAALLCKSGDPERGMAEAETCVTLAAPTPEDRYYRGLAYHILGQAAAANYERAMSQREGVVSNWPRYPNIYSNPKSSPTSSDASSRLRLFRLFGARSEGG
jgi:tetratricopeptide (TPR) repeat protein